MAFVSHSFYVAKQNNNNKTNMFYLHLAGPAVASYGHSASGFVMSSALASFRIGYAEAASVSVAAVVCEEQFVVAAVRVSSESRDLLAVPRNPGYSTQTAGCAPPASLARLPWLIQASILMPRFV